MVFTNLCHPFHLFGNLPELDPKEWIRGLVAYFCFHGWSKWDNHTGPLWTKIYGKVGCAFPMVIVPILPHSEFEWNDHWKDAPHLYKLHIVQTFLLWMNCSNISVYNFSSISYFRIRFCFSKFQTNLNTLHFHDVKIFETYRRQRSMLYHSLSSGATKCWICDWNLLRNKSSTDL